MKMGAILLMVVIAFFGGIAGTLFVHVLNRLWPDDPSETFAILFTGVAGATVAVIAVIAAIWGTFSARKIARSQTTLEHLTTMHTDGSFVVARQKFNKLIRAGDIAKYAEQAAEGTDETQAISTVLNEYELVSVGIQRGIIDPELYKRLRRSTVIFDWESSQSFVYALRKRAGRPALYHEFEEMAGWMSTDRLPHRRFWWAGL